MSEDVKPQRARRRYDSTRRQAQAAQTREDILRAAREAVSYTHLTLPTTERV